jgi:hypothetical protein
MHEFVMRGPVGLPTIIDYLNRWAPVVSGCESARIVRVKRAWISAHRRARASCPRRTSTRATGNS